MLVSYRSRPIQFLSLLIVVGLLVACGTPKLSKPSDRNKTATPTREVYRFPQSSRSHSGSNRRASNKTSQKKNADLLDLVTKINRANEKAAKGDMSETYALQDVPQQQIDQLPVAQQASWYKLRSLLAQDKRDLKILLASEQQLLTKTPSFSRTQHNTDLFARLLVFNQMEIALAREGVNGNKFSLGWLELLETMTSLPASYSQQKLAWQGWRRKFSGHSAEKFPPKQIAIFFDTVSTSPSFALLLPQSGVFAPFGKALAIGFNQVAAHPTNSNWQVETFDVVGNTTLAHALNSIVDAGTKRVVGPLDKALAQRVWDDSRIPNQVALNFVDNTSSLLLRGQLGLGVEDEAEWMAKLLNAHPNLRVGLLQQTGRNPSRAATRLLGKVKKRPEFYRFDNNKTLVQQLEKALNISASDIKFMKENISEHRKALQDATDDIKREWLIETDPVKQLQEKIGVDVLLLFANAEYSMQVMPLLDFYYAKSVRVIGYSAVLDLSRLNKQQEWDGMYVVDIPTMNKKPNAWHEWVSGDFVPDEQFYRFYALGVDAALVAHNLERLAAVPGIRIRGSTGRLGLDATTKRFTRDLQLYRVENGTLVSVRPQNLFVGAGI